MAWKLTPHVNDMFIDVHVTLRLRNYTGHASPIAPANSSNSPRRRNPHPSTHCAMLQALQAGAKALGQPHQPQPLATSDQPQQHLGPAPAVAPVMAQWAARLPGLPSPRSLLASVLGPLLQQPPPLTDCGANSGRRTACALEQQQQQEDKRLTVRSALDLNTRRCSIEAALHTRQRGTGRVSRLSVKWSESSSTRLAFSTQLPLRAWPGCKLLLSGDPQSLHAASLVLSSGAAPRGSAGTGRACAVPASSRRSLQQEQQHHQQHNQQQQEQQPGGSAASGRRLHAAATQAASTQLELGWQFRSHAPIVGVTRRFGAAATALTRHSGSSTSTSAAARGTHGEDAHDLPARPPVRGGGLLRAAYEAKARCLSLSAAGAGWSVTLALPTRGAGLHSLLPTPGQPGCRPKLSATLAPELLSCCNCYWWTLDVVTTHTPGQQAPPS